MIVALTDQLHWLEACYPVGRSGDCHVHGAPYLVADGEATVLVDTGALPGREALKAAIAETAGGLDAIVITKAHLPHSANIVDLLDLGPDVEVVGTVGIPESYGFVPPFADRVEKSVDGSRVDVAGTTFEFIVPPLLDMQHTTWLFHPATGALFTSDGLGHYHAACECAMTSRELPDGIPPAAIEGYHREALRWLRYVDPDRLMADVRAVFDGRDVSVVCPAHGNPVWREHLPGYLDDLERAVETIAGDFSLPER